MTTNNKEFKIHEDFNTTPRIRRVVMVWENWLHNRREFTSLHDALVWTMGTKNPKLYWTPDNWTMTKNEAGCREYRCNHKPNR